jgi:hypothetical protein
VRDSRAPKLSAMRQFPECRPERQAPFLPHNAHQEPHGEPPEPGKPDEDDGPRTGPARRLAPNSATKTGLAVVTAPDVAPEELNR